MSDNVAEKYWLVHSRQSNQKRCNTHVEVKREIRNLLRKSPVTGEYFANEVYVSYIKTTVDVTRVPFWESDLIDRYWPDESEESL